MTQGPSGTITFLFTDIVGSTRLWETDRVGMTSSLAVHDRIIREAIAANGGKVFATGGDSFSAAFPTAIAALKAAAEGHLGLENEDWVGPRITVRIGIHAGVADERDGNYFGPSVTRASRIMSAGHGRQTLLSSTAAELVRDDLESTITLVDLGIHPLKDLGRPEHLFELRIEGLPPVETRLGTEVGGGDHLPEQLTSFVGRSAELAAVTELLDDSRLVTLTGVGGTGKTRLAIEVARGHGERFADGVWMSELAPVSDSNLVLGEIADTWGLRPGEGATLMQVVSNYLSTRELLLIVDNCEHVLDTVARLLTDLIAVSPGLRILATSRESLGIPGEVVYRVPSMVLPVDNEEALHSDAVTLFLDRTRKILPDYSPSEEAFDAIIAVCRRLDGIPLALELAASRLRSLSPIELLDRLDHSFRLLTGGAKTALPRQRTLQAAIDWSYELLDPQERSLFRSASVFVGGFDLSAIEDVAGGADLARWEILDLVDQLADKSLLIPDPGTVRNRFHMLEPIRQYAQERLANEGEIEAVRSAHAEYYAEFVSRTEPRLRGPEQKTAHEELRREIDNIRLALSHHRESGRIHQLLQMCFNLNWFWSQASMQVEALDLILPCLESDPHIDSLLRVKAWWTASQLAFNLTDPKSVDYAERALELATATGDDMAIGWSSVMAAMAIRGTSDRSDERAFYKRGEKLIRENLDRAWWDPKWDEILLGWAHSFVGVGSASERWDLLSKSVTAAKSAGDMFVAAGIMTAAYFMRENDDDPRAIAYLEEAVDILGDLGFRHAYGHALMYWGRLIRDGQGEEAGESAMVKGAEILAEVGDTPCSLSASTNMAAHLLKDDRLRESMYQLGFAARQARTDPKEYTPWVADLAGQAAVEIGDLATAAVILGHQSNQLRWGPRQESEKWGAAVEEGLTEEDLSKFTQEGSSLDDALLLQLIEDWARQ